MDRFIAALEKKIEQYCEDHGRHEPDTNAFVFDSDEHSIYVEGLEDALELAQKINSKKVCLPRLKNMTKEDAASAIKKGLKVRHTSFSSSEWVMGVVGTDVLQFEDGVKCPSYQFWSSRQGTSWDTGWQVIK